MTFSRVIEAAQPPSGTDLTEAMIGIGMQFAGTAAESPNIEDTIVAAAKAGMDGNDLRTLAVLVSWLEVHHAWVNVDRLTRYVLRSSTQRTAAFWSSVARWLAKDPRWRRLADGYHGQNVDLLPVGTSFQIRRRGPDRRFIAGPLIVPDGTLRDRRADVLEPAQLAARHRAYRWRVVIGPTYRADMWAALEADPTLTVAELARRGYGSFATAWRVRRDWSVATGSPLDS